jgi:hypothetical protein
MIPAKSSMTQAPARKAHGREARRTRSGQAGDTAARPPEAGRGPEAYGPGQVFDDAGPGRRQAGGGEARHARSGQAGNASGRRSEADDPDRGALQARGAGGQTGRSFPRSPAGRGTSAGRG